MTARRTNIGPVRSPIKRIGHPSAAIIGRKIVRAAAGVAQILRPGPRRVKHQSLPVAFAELRLHRVIDAAGSAVTAIDAAPVRKWTIRQRTTGIGRGRQRRLIQIGRPWQLHRAVADVGNAKSRVPPEIALDRKAVLHHVRILERWLYSRAEIGVSVHRRANAGSPGGYLRPPEGELTAGEAVVELANVGAVNPGQRIENVAENSHRVHAEAPADRRLGIVERPPCKSKTRIKIVAVRKAKILRIPGFGRGEKWSACGSERGGRGGTRVDARKESGSRHLACLRIGRDNYAAGARQDRKSVV